MIGRLVDCLMAARISGREMMGRARGRDEPVCIFTMIPCVFVLFLSKSLFFSFFFFFFFFLTLALVGSGFGSPYKKRSEC